MSITTTSRIEDGFGIIDLAGKLTLGPTLREVRDSARNLLEKEKLAGLILDASEVTLVDSSGLGELTRVYTTAAKRNCPIRLVGASDNFQKLLHLTKLDAVLLPADSIASAKNQIKSR
ncbi:MAG: STAS domain-containing protein [Acidobacteriaceae bacterium]|nr:STAS domain-containing protein [Acidobacteriaceae bacterium]MBV9498030.1 STAS domain-containing protein [Acidobacteriaceae bacterium]